MTSPLDLTALQVGARVQETLLVWDVDSRTQPTGEPYVILELRNATGALATAPFWASDMHLVEGLTRGAAVSVIGEVEAWRGGRQLKVSSLRVVPGAQVDMARLLPSAGDVAPLWAAVDKAIADMREGPWRRAVHLFYADQDFRAAYERCPGSTTNHHAVLGGLLQHTVEMARIAWAIARQANGADWDLVLAGVLLHDIGKTRAYRWSGVFETTDEGYLIGHVALGALMLQERLAELAPRLTKEEESLLLHLVLSHHGRKEYGSPVEPMTLEAAILHQADDASATNANVADALGDSSHFAAGQRVSRRVWTIDGRLYRRDGAPR